MLKKILFCCAILGSSLTFSGCAAKPANTTTENPNVTIMGTLQSAAGKFSVVSNGKVTDLDSRRVDLSPYVGQIVKVTGQFSGTTLFVDSFAAAENINK